MPVDNKHHPVAGLTVEHRDNGLCSDGRQVRGELVAGLDHVVVTSSRIASGDAIREVRVFVFIVALFLRT